MVCDRIAASSIYAGDDYKNDAALKYLERSRDHMFIHKETLDELTYVLKMLAERVKTYFQIFKEESVERPLEEIGIYVHIPFVCPNVYIAISCQEIRL